MVLKADAKKKMNKSKTDIYIKTDMQLMGTFDLEGKSERLKIKHSSMGQPILLNRRGLADS